MDVQKERIKFILKKLNEDEGIRFKKLIDFLSKDYDLNDRGHKLEHVLLVTNLALDIGEFSKFSRNRELLILAGMFHDVKCHEDRDMHHRLGERYFRNNVDILKDFGYDLDEKDIELTAFAILEHRASYKGKYTSSLSAIISSADRGEPLLFRNMKRSVEYNVEYNPTFDEKAIRKSVVDHMKDKYGRDGYAKYPPVYNEFFKDQLEDMFVKIDKLQYCDKQFNDIFDIFFISENELIERIERLERNLFILKRKKVDLPTDKYPENCLRTTITINSNASVTINAKDKTIESIWIGDKDESFKCNAVF